jgi:hypothetical protein
MAVDQISQRALTAVFARLSTTSNGYNAGIAAQAPLYGLTASTMQLDFSPTSQNFYFDQIEAEDMEKTGTITYPFACLYVRDSVQTNEQKFTKFSGAVRCLLDVNLSWVAVRGTQNREAYSNCVEDVVIDVINRLDNQNWGKPLVYNGNIQCFRGRTVFGARNFVKKISFAMIFGVHQ